MSKQLIPVNEGPQHGTEIEIEGPVFSGQHIEHDGSIYRIINNGQYAQFCRTVTVVEQKKPKAPKAPKQPKAKAAKKLKAKA